MMVMSSASVSAQFLLTVTPFLSTRQCDMSSEIVLSPTTCMSAVLHDSRFMLMLMLHELMLAHVMLHRFRACVLGQRCKDAVIRRQNVSCVHVTMYVCQVFKTTDTLQKVCSLRVRYLLTCLKEVFCLDCVGLDVSDHIKRLIDNLCAVPMVSDTFGALVSFDSVQFATHWVHEWSTLIEKSESDSVTEFSRRVRATLCAPASGGNNPTTQTSHAVTPTALPTARLFAACGDAGTWTHVIGTAVSWYGGM